MSGLELILIHRFNEGSAICVDRLTNTIYAMTDEDEDLHVLDENSDEAIYLQGIRDYERPIPEPEKVFKSLQKATQYIDALTDFDDMVEYIINVYSDTGVLARVTAKLGKEKIEADLLELRDCARKGREILKTVPGYNERLHYLDTDPAEIIADLRRKAANTEP